MTLPANLFPMLLTTHFILSITHFLPAFMLPFTMRTRGTDGDPVVNTESGRFVRLLVWLEAHGTVIIGAGVAITGIAMLIVLGGAFLDQPWLMLALAIYATILAVSFFIQRPGIRRLLGLKLAATEVEKERWRVRARRQRPDRGALLGPHGPADRLHLQIVGHNDAVKSQIAPQRTSGADRQRRGQQRRERRCRLRARRCGGLCRRRCRHRNLGRRERRCRHRR